MADPTTCKLIGFAVFLLLRLAQCRVEGNPQGMAQFRVTVVSPLPSLSTSISHMVVANLTS